MADSPEPQERGSETLREDADIGTSSEDYARRFTGGVGRWFVETQSRLTLGLLRALPAGASILDVGGGHAQIAPPLIEAGYEVTVVGSDPVCATRLEPWITQGRCRFDAVDLRSLPYPDRSFDAVVCLRLLPHSIEWTGLIGELCRVAGGRSCWIILQLAAPTHSPADLFHLKRGIELNTRRFLLFTPQQINNAFREQGFVVREERPQFLFPMVLHRLANRATLSRVVETPGRLLGLTRWFGSPIIIRADRRAERLSA